MKLSLSSLPGPYPIAVYGLGATFLLSLISRPFWPTVLSALVLFTVGAIGQFAWKRELKWSAFVTQDTFISTMIIALLLEPASSIPEIFPIALVAALAIVLRIFVRYKVSPLINPAAGAIGAAVLISYTGLISAPLGSWWGANYALTLGDIRLTVGTVISMILCALIVARNRKQWFAGIFFALVAVYMLTQGNFMNYFLDGTVFFFFGLMACEPKTSPISKVHQITIGIVLAGALIASFVWHLPSGYIFALVLANIVRAGITHVPFLKKLFTF